MSAPSLLLIGLWHLGSVTAANVCEYYEVVGWDPDSALLENLRKGVPPISEPGMTEALRAGIASGKLTFTSDAVEAAKHADIVWCTFDTPVDDNDEADVEFVLAHIERLLPTMRDDALVIMSSQVPIGSGARLAASARRLRPDANIRFAAIPENLRLGQAMEIFRNPDRVVAGVDGERTREQIAALYAPFGMPIEWMSIASAEMTKHGINAFLAMSLSFIGEIAALCEKTGADVAEVSRGLRSESRIGPKAYLTAGPGYAGGTLARDIVFLSEAAEREGTIYDVFAAVNRSNEVHRAWTRRKLHEIFGDDLKGKTIACWGLTYKPGTDTLRRSTSVELCQYAASRGARVIAFDPSIHALPSDLASAIELAPSAIDACKGADALAVLTEWPEFASVDASAAIAAMAHPNVVDPKRFLEKTLRSRSNYYGIGIPKLAKERVNA